MTHHRVSTDPVAAVAHAGRGRWKIANENNHVLKTQGDHVAHNFGHGQPSLSAFLRRLTLLALLFHTVLEWSAAHETLLRPVLARRPTFFDAIRTFTRSMVFDRWHHLMDCMIRGLELTPKLDTC